MAGVDPYSPADIFDDLDPDDRLSVAQLMADGGAVVGTVDQITTRLKNTTHGFSDPFMEKGPTALSAPPR